jgi:hypothetical protein
VSPFCPAVVVVDNSASDKKISHEERSTQFSVIDGRGDITKCTSLLLSYAHNVVPRKKSVVMRYVRRDYESGTR